MTRILVGLVVFGRSVDRGVAQVSQLETWEEVFRGSWVQPELLDLGYEARGVGPQPDSVQLDTRPRDAGFIGHGFGVGADSPVVMPVLLMPEQDSTITVAFDGIWCQEGERPRLRVSWF